MKAFIYGLIIYIFLALPPVVELTESIMAIHMHVQMPFLAVCGALMTPLLQKKFPGFFEKWNRDGIPGILLALIVIGYWLIPRAMDDALMSSSTEIFKFISWPFLVGLPIWDSWRKLTKGWKNFTLLTIGVLYTIMAFIYIFAPDQLCNNYLIVDQRTLGWSFLIIAVCIVIYQIQDLFYDEEMYG